jgi:hypothetical protein
VPRVTETPILPLSAHTLQAVQVLSKSVGNEGDFTREAEIVFRPYLATHCSGVIETSHLVVPNHATEAVQLWARSVGNEGNFTREAETVFRP